MSLSLLLKRELQEDVAVGLETYGCSARDGYVADVEALGVPHIDVPSLTRSWDLRADGRATRELRAALAQLRPDIVHTHNPKTGVMGRMVARSLNIPVIVNTCHGLWIKDDADWKRRALVLGAEGVAARCSHAELFQNRNDAKLVRPYLLGRAQETVGNGVDLTRFSVKDRTRRSDAAQRLRSEWGFGGSAKPIVLGVGRLVPDKGIREFARLAHVLSTMAHFVWVGPTDEATAIGEVPHSECVVWAGKHSDMPLVYEAADIFTLPTYREGFCRSAMEAGATGLPVIISDIPGCVELGEHDVHLLFAQVRNVDHFASLLRDVLESPGLYRRLSQSIASRAQSHFDQTLVAQRSLHTYAAIAAERRLGWIVERSDAKHTQVNVSDVGTATNVNV